MPLSFLTHNLISDMKLFKCRGERNDNGETLAFLVLWPTLFVAILLLLVHTFIVVNAQAEAEIAASAALKAAWHAADGSDFRTVEVLPGQAVVTTLYEGTDPHPGVLRMSNAAKDAAATTASRNDGWRWWAPGATEVRSDWCRSDPPQRPPRGQAGWVQIKVEGEVFGPMAALWPGRLDRVYAVATGPAVLNGALETDGYALPEQDTLAIC